MIYNESIVYNSSMINYVYPPGAHTTFTYGDILGQFGDTFLSQILTISIFLLIYNTFVLYYVTGWKTVSYGDILKNNPKIPKRAIKAKILHEGAFICWMLSLYYPLIIFGQLTGWYN